MKWDAPTFDELFEIDRTILTLPIKKVTAKTDGKKETAKTKQQKERILSHMKENGSITTVDAAEILQVGVTRVKTLFYDLIDSGEIVALGDDKNRSYLLAETKGVRSSPSHSYMKLKK